jgi:hypothetical protein
MTAIIDVSAVDRPVIVITRDFDAPRELVWKAITDPKQVAVWYGGPGFSNPVCEWICGLVALGTTSCKHQTARASRLTASSRRSSSRNA